MLQKPVMHSAKVVTHSFPDGLQSYKFLEETVKTASLKLQI